jgi:predicted enzyme related to lactoylglutathione lyase
MLNLNNVMLGTSQLDAMAKFYEQVFGRPADMNDGGFRGWSVGNMFFSVGEHSEVKGSSKEPQRIILNFETTDVKGEFARLKALGATIVKEPYGMNEKGEVIETDDAMWIATFADPDGNYFQLMSPWEDNKSN